MTKKEYLARRADWDKAMAEGRIVCFPELSQSRSYPTEEMRDAALAEAEKAGVTAYVAQVGGAK